ncbi:MAG: hypothetical protein JZU50_05885 [Desulfobulbaceae bacterium]|nr:hypothetical protein [Desulfobulbaceae bacterium]
MIRVMTLNTSNEQDGVAMDPQEHLGQLQRAEIDILCCQGLWRSMDGSEDQARVLSESLGMPYSCFIPGPCRQSKQGASLQGISGLAIMGGAGMWMLNSGSIPVISEPGGTKARAQFALFRKNGTSVLVLNLQLCGSKQSQLLQLRGLFSHSLLKEKYGAVVLCGDRQAGMTVKKLRTITGKSSYAPHQSLISGDGSFEEGMLCILTAKEHPVAAVSLFENGLGQVATSCSPAIGNRQAGLSLDFAMDRIPQDAYNKSFLPMSFEEQWSGYKAKAGAVA